MKRMLTLLCAALLFALAAPSAGPRAQDKDDASIRPEPTFPSYSVIPVLFSPTDWDVNSPEVQEEATALRAAMSEVRDFYRANLDGRTFRLNDVQVVQAYGPKEKYGIRWNGRNIYEDGVEIVGNLEAEVVQELYERGYPTPPGQNMNGYVTIIFVKGAGGWAGGRSFSNGDGGWAILGDWCIDSIQGTLNDGQYWWSGPRKQTGAAAHELGHGFGLPHPDAYGGDWARTIMGHWFDYETPALLSGLDQWGHDYLLNNKSAYFPSTPPSPPFNNATFVSQTVPSVMTAGQSYNVSVTLRNTGRSFWTAARDYRLGSQNPQDNLTWRIGRVFLPHSAGPNQTVTFSFNVTAPAHPGRYNFQWRVLRESYEWFGDLTPNVEVQVVPPPPVYEGFHDGADCSNISGWAWDRNRPDTPINVDIYADGALHATVPANLFRQDLLDAGIGNGYHAFGYAVPPALRDAQPHSITVRVAGTNVNLNATPRAIYCGRYIDVPPDDPFYHFIECLSRRRIVGGYADNTFRPNNPVTRAQFVKMVVLATGWPLLNPMNPRFTDVPRTHPFYQFVETAAARGIIGGYADGTFRPDTELTRGQMAKVIVTAGQQAWGWTLNTSGGPHFVDVPSDQTFYVYVETAYNRGLISGYAGGYFYPGNNATRAQAAKVVSIAVGCTY